MATGTMQILDPTGDTKVIWDSENEAEVENARQMFKRLKKKGYIAYAVKGDGGKGKIVTDFDPDSERVILSPPMKGG